VFAAPRTEPDPDAETSPKKDADKDKKPREMLYQPAAPTPMVPAVPASNPRPAVQGPRVVPASPAAPTAPPLPGSTSTRGGRAPGVFDKLVSSIRTVGGESAPTPIPSPEPTTTIPGWGYPLLPTAPVAAPVWRPITARGATPDDDAKVVRAGGPIPGEKAGAVRPVNHTTAATAGGCASGSCGPADGHGGLFPCKISPFGNVRCLGHGNLDGYRFATAVVKPCPPVLPLAVKACYGLRPICSTAPTWGGAGECRTGGSETPNTEAVVPPVADPAVPAVPTIMPPVQQPLTSP
ncbi:MAG: hypothetical protein ACRC7O_18535, partial [Fimbriiglobus sp.]